MKKFIILLILTLSISSYSQIYNYKATAFASKHINDYGYWTTWTEWQYSDVKIVFNSYTDIITIYSKTPQVYNVKEYLGKTEETDGSTQIHWIVRDMDYLKAKIRLRKEYRGTLQLYVEYSDIIWVYNIKQI